MNHNKAREVTTAVTVLSLLGAGTLFVTVEGGKCLFTDLTCDVTNIFASHSNPNRATTFTQDRIAQINQHAGKIVLYDVKATDCMSRRPRERHASRAFTEIGKTMIDYQDPIWEDTVTTRTVGSNTSLELDSYNDGFQEGFVFENEQDVSGIDRIDPKNVSKFLGLPSTKLVDVSSFLNPVGDAEIDGNTVSERLFDTVTAERYRPGAKEALDFVLNTIDDVGSQTPIC